MDGNDVNRVQAEWIAEWMNADGGIRQRIRNHIWAIIWYPVLGSCAMIGLLAIIAVPEMFDGGVNLTELDPEIGWVAALKRAGLIYVGVCAAIAAYSIFCELQSLYLCINGRGVDGQKVNGYRQN